MHFDTEATICAIATGYENGCRGAVRVAGSTTLAILEKIQPIPESLRNAKRATRVSVDWDLRAPLGSIPVDVWFWPTDRSYTGTPSAELHTLGNQVLLKRMLEQLCEAGARLAMPGEFTLRAFLAGRMDLAQCEAVLGVIEAESQEALDISLRQLAGGLSEPLAKLRRSLIDLLADLEAGLDFVDEDIQFISRVQVIDRLTSALTAVERLLRQLNLRQLSQHAPKVALLGLPNAGKSSLANAIAKKDAAIVSNQAGTTRDFVRVHCTLQHGEVELIDTAGIETEFAADHEFFEVMRHAQGFANEQRDEADLIFYCIDCHLDISLKQEQIECAFAISGLPHDSASESVNNRRSIGPSNVWIIWTKADLLDSKADGGFIRLRIEHIPSQVTSCFDPLLLEQLRKRLDDWLVQREEEASSVAPMTAIRCKESLRSAHESLQTAFSAADQRSGDEIVAGEIRLALDHLAQVAGQVYTDDVLDALFSRFCIGK